jgi:hypothetical protein
MDAMTQNIKDSIYNLTPDNLKFIKMVRKT